MGIDAKRQTLIFGVELAVTPRLALPPPPYVRRSVMPDVEAVDSGWDAVQTLSSNEMVNDDENPSSRVTVPNDLAPKPFAPSYDDIEELPASDLESDRSLATTRPPPPHRPSLFELALALKPAVTVAPAASNNDRVRTPVSHLALVLDHDDEPAEPAKTPTSVPPFSIDVRPPLASLPGDSAHSYPVPRVTPRYALIFVASHLAVAATVSAFVWSHSRQPPILRHRDTHIALDDRSPLSSAAGAAAEMVPPVEGCRVQDLSRVIARHAELGPGLDASVLESGFGVGLVSATNEATGIRLDASTLRTAETVRVQSLWPVARVALEHDADSRLEVRIDANDSRTVAPSRRILAQKGGVFFTEGDGRKHLLWAIPGLSPRAETVRAVTRPDGANVVVIRRAGVIWAGITGQGPLTPIHRPKKTIGTPTLVPSAEGAIVAWAERGTSGGFSIVASSIEADGKHTNAAEPLPLADGISPALAALPSGELLLTYADGGAGAHRVVAQRLGADLSIRGDLLVLSPSGVNAGQPAIAVDAEGRAIVAYLAIENGRAEVHATALICQ